MHKPSCELSSLLAEFPSVQTAFAYGSAVFKQEGQMNDGQTERMIDLIFCTDNSESWHKQNLQLHPDHYSSLALGGPRFLAAIQEQIGAGVYYNTLIRVRGRLIKYGVVQRSTLIDDLLHWHTMYLSGRMHKPVLMLTPICDGISAAMTVNSRSALATALLLLPPRFNEVELFMKICGLSYDGDVRMGVGESWSKVRNIVAGQLASLREIYAQPIRELQSCSSYPSASEELSTITTLGKPRRATSSVTRAVLIATDDSNNGLVSYEQDMSLEGRRQLIDLVPSNVKHYLHHELVASKQLGSRAHRQVTEDLDANVQSLHDAVRNIWTHSADSAAANRILSNGIHQSIFCIVRRASLAQTLKGVATAGPLRSARYAFSKIRRRILVS